MTAASVHTGVGQHEIEGVDLGLPSSDSGEMLLDDVRSRQFTCAHPGGDVGNGPDGHRQASMPITGGTLN